MSDSPSIRGVAMIAWIDSDQTYEAICEVLDIRSSTRYDAFFLSEDPPVDPAREGSRVGVDEYEREIQESHTVSE
ncbi:hypothetical protein [Halorubrum coriense]|uniref:hypothetical protein n=1 Tax=Halorubrum coriense TaxID=64713 RepID=UPI0012689A38|nr:hypothetical protein [Halorubrum coriense]